MMKKEKIIKFTDYLSFYVHQNIAFIILTIIKDRNITPNEVTFVSLILGVISALCIYFDMLITAVLMLQLSFIFDCLDGQLARYKALYSKYGMWLDNISDRVVESFVIISIAIYYDFHLAGLFVVFAGMLYSYMSDLDIYAEVKYLPLTKLEKIFFSPVYLLNRSFIILFLSVGVFFPFVLFLMLCLYSMGIFFRVYRKFYGIAS